MKMSNILKSNIARVSQLLLDGKVLPTELITTSLQTVDKNRHLNALINITRDEAKKKSEESLMRYTQNKRLSDIDGIPFVLKDNFCTNGIRTTCASKMLEKFEPPYNATVYEKLLAAGCILVGKSNLDQFAMGSGTVDSIFGPTKNIWGYDESKDDFYISGGSSGGSAVAVASGICFAGIGSDTGGSVRIPASYCGVVGLKPTYGLVSRYGLIPLVHSMDVPGLLTRTVDDCVMILNKIAGYDPKDSTSLARQFRPFRLPSEDKLTVKGLKVGIPKEFRTEYLSDEVLETWNDVANLLLNSGAIIKDVSLPHAEFSIVCYSVLNQCEVASNMAKYDGIEFGHRESTGDSLEELLAKSRAVGFNDVVKNRILTGNYFLLTQNYEKYFQRALKVRRLIHNDFDAVWDDVHVLLTPTTPSTAPLYSDYVKKTNREQASIHDFYTQPVNMAGVPAVSIPIRVSNNGLPISLQLIGKNCSEAVILTVGKFIEKHVQFKNAF